MVSQGVTNVSQIPDEPLRGSLSDVVVGGWGLRRYEEVSGIIQKGVPYPPFARAQYGPFYNLQLVVP